MHIPDGFLNLGVSAGTGAVAAAGIAIALKKAREKLDEKTVPLLGMSAAFIFAAQMLNFPIAGGTSGHFLGAALAALLLGPHLGSLVITIVLIIQALLFADGGLSALGANVFNMAIVGVWGAYLAFLLLQKLLPEKKGWFLTSGAIAAWFSVVLASAACALELAISGTSPLSVALPAMAGVHSLIGLVEGCITVLVLSPLVVRRPDLIYSFNLKPARETGFTPREAL
jgi:cobalt/nickel transport system permease protein